MIVTEIVLETSASYRHLSQLIAPEDFIVFNLEFLLVSRYASCIKMFEGM